MLEIGNCIVSLDVLETKFSCRLDKCKGGCCLHGDSGAPLLKEEIPLIESAYKVFKKYLRPEGIKAVEEQGIHLVDFDGDVVTPLIDGNECAYTILEDGIYKCAIEKAWFQKEIDFRKPVSCHLYPIRIKEYKDFDAVNYDKWEICKHAVRAGNEDDISLLEFCKDSLVRRYGLEWYEELRKTAKILKKQGKIK
ncbi:MAG: DUF3109 family protein [Bacteroidales bacterium]|nr:DUF3109 family protein [Bacteroidales bacterium]